MKNAIRSLSVVAVAACLAGAVCLAQSSGEATYKAHCQSCHGASGVPSPSMGKMMGIKPVTDPAINKLTVAEMFTAVKGGKGKMRPFAGKLTDPEIKASVTYYHGLK